MLRVIDTQMMLQRPPELVSSTSREQTIAGMNPTMQVEEDKRTEQRMHQVGATEKDTPTRTDKDGHNQQQGDTPARSSSEDSTAASRPPKTLAQRASDRLLGLEVSESRFVRSTSSFDQLV